MVFWLGILSVAVLVASILLGVLLGGWFFLLVVVAIALAVGAVLTQGGGSSARSLEARGARADLPSQDDPDRT